MVEALHPNEQFTRDLIAEKRGAFSPHTIAHDAAIAAQGTLFPGTKVMLDDMIGKRALEKVAGSAEALEMRRSAADDLYQGMTTSALYLIIAKLAPSAILKTLGYIRHDTLVPALQKLRDSDERLAGVSDDELQRMAVNVQTAVETYIGTQYADVATAVPATRLEQARRQQPPLLGRS